jgi:hypothetical protein
MRSCRPAPRAVELDRCPCARDVVEHHGQPRCVGCHLEVAYERRAVAACCSRASRAAAACARLLGGAAAQLDRVVCRWCPPCTTLRAVPNRFDDGARRSFSESDVVGDSPVVPLTTSPSTPGRRGWPDAARRRVEVTVSRERGDHRSQDAAEGSAGDLSADAAGMGSTYWWKVSFRLVTVGDRAIAQAAARLRQPVARRGVTRQSADRSARRRPGKGAVVSVTSIRSACGSASRRRSLPRSPRSAPTPGQRLVERGRRSHRAPASRAGGSAPRCGGLAGPDLVRQRLPRRAPHHHRRAHREGPEAARSSGRCQAAPCPMTPSPCAQMRATNPSAACAQMRLSVTPRPAP